MPYPDRLIPKPTDVLIEELPGEDILCRWSNYPVMDEETNKLSALAVDEKRIPGYSTNKIPPSQQDDILIDFYIKDKFLIPWSPGEIGLSVNEGDYYTANSRQYFFIQIKDISGFTDKYPFPYSENESDFVFSYEVKVIHSPLKVNFSHCEFKIIYFDNQGNPGSSPSRKSLEKVVIAGIRDRLIKVSKFDMFDFFH